MKKMFKSVALATSFIGTTLVAQGSSQVDYVRRIQDLEWDLVSNIQGWGERSAENYTQASWNAMMAALESGRALQRQDWQVNFPISELSPMYQTFRSGVDGLVPVGQSHEHEHHQEGYNGDKYFHKRGYRSEGEMGSLFQPFSLSNERGLVNHTRITQQTGAQGHGLAPERTAESIDRIVTHHTVSNHMPTVEATNSWWSGGGRNWDRGGYHFIIRHDGSIWQMVPLLARSWGAGVTANPRSIHIAIAGNFTEQNLPSQAAQESYGWLVRELLNNPGLPNLNHLDHVTRHSDWMATLCSGFTAAQSRAWIPATTSGTPIAFDFSSSTAAPPVQAPPTTDVRTGQVTAPLRFRRDPSTNQAEIRILSIGQTVTILEEAEDWLRIRIGSEEGYVHRNWIRITEATAPTAPTPPTTAPSTERTGTVTAGLHFRRDPSTNQDPIRLLPVGQSVTILGETGQWFRIRVGTEEGYVHRNWLQVAQGTPAPPTTPAPAPTPPATDVRTGQVTAPLRFRRDPSTNQVEIRTLAVGQNVTILGETGDWFRIRIGSEEGYVHRNWVRISGTAAPTAPSTERTGTVTTGLNFRRDPSTNQPYIRTLPVGQSVTILGETGQWLRVRVGTEEGYVHGNWVRRN